MRLTCLPEAPEDPLETHTDTTPWYFRPGHGPSLLVFAATNHVSFCCFLSTHPPTPCVPDSAQYNQQKRRDVPSVLRLLPLLPADGLPAEPDNLRPFSFTVISTTPGVKPLAVGVTGEQQDTQWGGGQTVLRQHSTVWHTGVGITEGWQSSVLHFEHS